MTAEATASGVSAGLDRARLRAHLERTLPPDPFGWLEDPDSARTRDWTHLQDDAFRAAAAGWPHRDRFVRELTELDALADPVSAPRPAGDRMFLMHLAPGAEHAALVVVEPDGRTRSLLDPGRLDPTGATTLEAWHPSWDGRLLACQLASGGTENAELFVLDVDTGERVDGPIDRVRNTMVAWLPGRRGFYYVRRLDPRLHPGEGDYHRRVHLHALGTSPDDDVVVFGDGRSATQHYTVRTDPQGRWLVVTASAGTSPRLR